MDNKIFLKACNFCVYQERTQDEVRTRLKEWQVYGDEVEEIIAKLILENFISEERFAKIYAGSKFRVKKWGKRKILQELKFKRLSPYCIKKGLQEIDDDEYYLVLQALLHKKLHALRNETNSFVRKQKASVYAFRKGYESQLIWEILEHIDLTKE
ncbi:MAG: regulatory protein [Arcticibacterium sp.]|jgi:regulatory protein